MSDQISAARQMSRDNRVYGKILTVLGIFAIMSPVFTFPYAPAALLIFLILKEV